jgi:hypothetical protein
MSEHAKKIKATLAELEEELRTLPSVDHETRRVLEETVAEIQSALAPDEPGELESQSLIDRLSETTQQFEASHPTLSGIITRLIDGLGQMGI